MSAVNEHVRSVVGALGHPEWATLADHGERLQRLQSELPRAVWRKVQTAVTTRYHDLEQRYGRPTAVAIVSAGVLGTALPLPGTSIVAVAPLIGLAELHHRLTATTDPRAELLAQVTRADAEIRRLAERWLQDLAQLVQLKHDVQDNA
jgi:hypothetical protein